MTPRGRGVLRSVFEDEAQVELDAGPKGKVTFFHPSEVGLCEADGAAEAA
jgi:hypothetical protein